MRRTLAALGVALLVVAACSDDDDDGGATPAGPDTDFEVSISLEPDHALVGRLVVDGEADLAPTVEVVGDERSFEIPVATESDHHEIPVVGLRAESDYTVTVSHGDRSVDVELRTGALPPELPAPTVTTSDPDRMSEGVTLFNLLDLGDALSDEGPQLDENGDPPRSGYLVAVDAEGEIVWYHRSDHPIGDVRQLPDGRLLHEYNDTGARIIDLFGTTRQEWGGEIISGPLELDGFGRRVLGDDAITVGTDAMHHEVSMLDNGNLLAVSAELRTWEGFDEPLCGETGAFDGSYELISDVIVEFEPDGDVVAEYPLAAYFDPVNDPRDQNVCGLPFANVFPNWLYWAQGNDEAKDWTHANGVVVAPGGDALTVSVRHLDAILQIDRESGDLLWRLGPGGDFDLADEADFNYHQHAPEWQDDGTLLFYDNGNGRPPEGDDDHSRAALMRLDPEAGTAELVWEYVSNVDGAPAFAPFVGDADRLDNGNVLITNGGYQGRADGITAQLVEVVPDDDGEGGDVVFELRLDDTDMPYIVYRAERLPGFYPQG